ncbi:U1 small nuclear ribonucleoprotein 70 kDa-like isoform X5 [Mytilus californianus]|uniref:U1 small nuclear ribonucleoprotein 70 kDa-like isoform X5 n=1 Tax=Mytilus californianus TaxID=6549 RepID=UPI002245F6AB|nr:U1 small nuclear ribonucleoprotein 70 kDa-like isoform X5 [Mytilus californianus]
MEATSLDSTRSQDGAPREPEKALTQDVHNVNIDDSDDSVNSVKSVNSQTKFISDHGDQSSNDHDDSGEEGWARLKPGAKKRVKTKSDGIRNRKQSLRMKKSRAIKKFQKLKDKLLKEQVYEPVEVLYVIYEKKTKKFKYDGSGFLLRQFENGKPLSKGVPRRNLKDRRSIVDLDMSGSKEKGVKFLTPHKYRYSFALGQAENHEDDRKVQTEDEDVSMVRDEDNFEEKDEDNFEEKDEEKMSLAADQRAELETIGIAEGEQRTKMKVPTKIRKTTTRRKLVVETTPKGRGRGRGGKGRGGKITRKRKKSESSSDSSDNSMNQSTEEPSVKIAMDKSKKGRGRGRGGSQTRKRKKSESSSHSSDNSINQSNEEPEDMVEESDESFHGPVLPMLSITEDRKEIQSGIQLKKKPCQLKMSVKNKNFKWDTMFLSNMAKTCFLLLSQNMIMMMEPTGYSTLRT